MNRARPARALALASAALAVWLPAPALAASPGANVLVSRPSAFGPLATPTTNHSAVVLSDEGSARTVADEDNHRYVAFVSDADGLSDADDDRVSNVFVRDRALDVTILVSRADGPAGAGADGNSSEPSISANGRYVAFESGSTNLAPGATGLSEHVYVRDLLSGTTRLVDRAAGPDGAIADAGSFDPAITTVGGNPVVAFSSGATNLDGATNGEVQIYVRAAGDTEMLSRPDASTSTAGDGASSNPSISTDGAFVAFQSSATNLVPGDGNLRDDVFVRTRGADDTRVISQTIALGNGDSRDPSISGDGNEIAFTSTSTNLVGADSNTRRDVYVRRIAPFDMALASRATGAAGAIGSAESSQPSISDDGNAVVFSSPSDNLAPPDANGVADVFMRSGGTTTSLVSRPAVGVESDGASVTASIARGPSTIGNRFVAFTTAADNMGADDEDDFAQVYGRVTGVFIVGPNPAIYLSRPSGAGPFRSGVNASHLRSPERSSENVAAMSQDGRFTVFLSAEDDLSPEDGDRFINVYRRDNLTGETILVSRADGAAGAAANGTSGVSGGGLVIAPGAPSGAPSISADGNRIAFASAATNLVAGDANGLPDVFVRDVAAGSTVLASRDGSGAGIPFPSGDPAISGDGTKVAFVSRFEGDALDVNMDSDVYLRDLAEGTTKLVSRRGAGPAGDDGSGSPAIDADGSHVAFATDATDMNPVITDANMNSDIFVRDIAAGQVHLVSGTPAGTATADGGSFAPAISADGNRIAFSSGATDLVVAVDVNAGFRDVFVRDMAAASTTLVSRTAGANGISGNGGSERASIDASGTRIAFETGASDLVPGDLNGVRMDVLVRDTVAQTTELVSRGDGVAGAQAGESSGTPSISGNGDCVAFETFTDDFVPMPAGTDHARVIARALRGNCPFGPLPAPPGGPPPGSPATPDTTRPVLSRVSLAPRRFLAGKRVRPRTRRRPAIGARLRFTLSEAATVTIRIDALLPGRRLRQRCVPPRRAPRGRVCKRRVRRGALTHAGGQGANRRNLTGRLRGKRLPPGAYRATLKAKDAAGNVSAPRRVEFTVLRPR